MEARMFRVLTLMAVLAGGGIGFAFTSHDALALPLPTVSASVAAPTLIEKTGWRRQSRRQDDGPVVVVPDTDVAVDPMSKSTPMTECRRSSSCRRRARRAAGSIATGTASVASTRATTRPISDRDNGGRRFSSSFEARSARTSG